VQSAVISIGLLMIFVVIAVVLLASNRGKPSPASDALRALARQTQGTFARQFVGFGKVVKFQTDGWPLTFKVSSSLHGPSESIASNQSLNAYGEYRLLRPFELELEPRGGRGVLLPLATSRPPVVTSGIPEIDNAYVVRTSDVPLAAALLGDPEVRARLLAACQPTSSICVGPLTEGLLKRTREGMGGVALNEEEETLAVTRLLAIRDVITALLDGLAQQHVAERP
jgi:hypothetical protein